MWSWTDTRAICEQHGNLLYLSWGFASRLDRLSWMPRCEAYSAAYAAYTRHSRMLQESQDDMVNALRDEVASTEQRLEVELSSHADARRRSAMAQP